MLVLSAGGGELTCLSLERRSGSLARTQNSRPFGGQLKTVVGRLEQLWRACQAKRCRQERRYSPNELETPPVGLENWTVAHAAIRSAIERQAMLMMTSRLLSYTLTRKVYRELTASLARCSTGHHRGEIPPHPAYALRQTWFIGPH
jgi:hypothetical protein